MHLHEYQAKTVLRNFGVNISDFTIVTDIADAEKAIDDMKLTAGVVKVQVHAGGRGKAGGVKLARTKQALLDAIKQLLGMRIVNNQTGKEGVIAHQVLISPLIDYEKEYYLAATIDRNKAQPILIVSSEGGMDIEETAAKTPEKILTIPIPSNGILRSYQFLDICKLMGWTGDVAEQGMRTVAAVAEAFLDTDAELLEINPLVLTKAGDIVALDAKLTIDDNALFRQKELATFFDPTQLNPNEAEAQKHDLAYVAMDGNIGCMVNGAGLAMATMDIIQHYGGSPANFLDVGGGASEDKIGEGFKIIMSDPKVKAVLINIFGGIMNCVTLAGGIIAASASLKLNVPLIVRMEGTNVETGKKLFEDSGLNIIIADNLAEAAQKAVIAAKQNNQ